VQVVPSSARSFHGDFRALVELLAYTAAGIVW